MKLIDTICIDAPSCICTNIYSAMDACTAIFLHLTSA